MRISNNYTQSQSNETVVEDVEPFFHLEACMGRYEKSDRWVG